MAESLIDIAVSKGIRDMKECSDRGIRNLVDLGKRLSKGNAQQDFFSFAQRILENPQSAYYQLSKRVIDQTDERFLKSFGMNLGYHVWTADAEKIRAFARKHGFALPWKFIFDLRFPSQRGLSLQTVKGILHQGESLGIECSLFFVGKEEELLIDMIELSGENPHACAFAFCEPDAVSVTAVSRALQYGNTMFVLSDQDRYSNSITAVEAMLNGRGVLYGTYRVMEEFCSDDAVRNGLDDADHENFCFLIDGGISAERQKKDMSEWIRKTKTDMPYHSFIIDFYEDFSYIDHAICARDTFLSIDASGNVSTKRIGDKNTGFNINKDSIYEICRACFPLPQFGSEDCSSSSINL